METDNFDDDVESEPAGPYARSADSYFAAGWAPVPVIGKWPPPTGWTGREGKWPSFPDVQAWKDVRGADNVALRLPDGVIAIDVDAYDSKHGDATLDECEKRWGALPSTWVSSSRTGVSGIRYYRTPKGLSWPGQLPGGDVELILWSHRYAMVPPSMHPSGAEYVWRGPDDLPTDQIPKPSDLPVLPSGWIIGLVRGQFAEVPRAEVSARTWLVKLGGDQLCVKMAAHCDEALKLITSGSRHDSLLEAQMHVIRSGERGHTGARTVLIALQARFSELVTGDGSRSVAAAEGEWARALDGAVSRVAATPTARMSTGDPCENVSAATLTSSLAQVRADDDTNAHDQQDARQDESESVEQGPWEHTPWRAYLSGRLVSSPPVALARSDGAHFFYAGRSNGIIGPSESGKSWLALEALRQHVLAGKRCMIVDFEDQIAGVGDRLRALGVTDEQIETLTRYISPDSPLDTIGSSNLARELVDFAPELIIVDGVNAAMAVLGLELMSNNDATRFHQLVLAPLAKTGAVVIYVDHTPKNDAEKLSSGGIGAQAKRAMTSGCTIRVEAVEPFGRGQTGVLKLTVDKDRDGHVRALAVGSIVGTVTIDSGEFDGAVSIVIAPPEKSASGTRPPMSNRERVERCLQMQTHAISGNAIVTWVGGRRSDILQAIRSLVDDGTITSTVVGQSVLHELTMLAVPGSGDSPAVPEPVQAGMVPDHYEVGSEGTRPVRATSRSTAQDAGTTARSFYEVERDDDGE